MRRTTYVLLIVSLIIAIDQITKYLIVTYVNPSDSVRIFSFLHLVLIRNTGAAFGMFQSLGNVFFIVLSIIAILFVIWLMVRGKEGYFSLSLILGGATGNLIDRILYGNVVDFIDFSIGKFHWYTFNIADAALTVGIIMYFLTSHSLLKHGAKK